MTADLECDCYPGGFNPATYEGPQEWCPVHGRSRAEFIALLDAARAENDAARRMLQDERNAVAALEATIARVEALSSGVRYLVAEDVRVAIEGTTRSVFCADWPAPCNCDDSVTHGGKP